MCKMAIYEKSKYQINQENTYTAIIQKLEEGQI